MPEHIQNHPSLLVVSDTGMYREGGNVYAFGPVVKELEVLMRLFSSITWIGFNRLDKKKNASYVKIPSEKIKVLLLDRVGGTSIANKVAILKSYPTMYRIINKQIKKHTFIHGRAPSNPAFIAMRLSKKHPTKRFWFKYAGNWTDSAPFFYNLQRNTLKKLASNVIITVNGKWENQPKNVMAFENPCLTKEDRKNGKELLNSKTLQDPIRYCFVGGLNENKGVQLLIQAFETLDTNKQPVEVHIVGDGPLRKWVEETKKKLQNTVIVHGSLPKEKVYEVYKKCHFIVLPSKSEGFPKVISEAMNFGCIPIVSTFLVFHNTSKIKKMDY